MKRQIRIGVFMANGQAARHRQRGMLRFAAQHPDLRLRFLLPHRPDIQHRFTCTTLPTAQSHQTEIYDELPDLAHADWKKPGIIC